MITQPPEALITLGNRPLPTEPMTYKEEKSCEYERGGVREYWLIDPQTRQAGFFLLGEKGSYHPIPLEEGGIFRSRVLTGWRIKVEWLWTPHPKLLDVLKEWGLI